MVVTPVRIVFIFRAIFSKNILFLNGVYKIFLSGKDIAEVFYKSIQLFGLERKIQGITIDNVSSNTTFVKELKKILFTAGIEFDEVYQHFKCFAHIFNLCVQDILKLLCSTADIFEPSLEIDEPDDEDTVEEAYEETDAEAFSLVVYNIRETFKKIRNSQSIRKQFIAFCGAKEIDYLKPILDVQTRWNSTFEMLKRALKLKEALILLWNSNSILNSYSVTESEWSSIEKLCPLLGHIKHISTILEKEDELTLSTAVMVFNLLADKMEETMEELATTNNNYDIALAYAIQAGRDKMVKHYSQCNWIYDVALILDPRHKYLSFDSTEWGKEIKDKAIKKFENIFRTTYFQPEVVKPDKKRQKTDFESEIDFKKIFTKKKMSQTGKRKLIVIIMPQMRTTMRIFCNGGKRIAILSPIWQKWRVIF